MGASLLIFLNKTDVEGGMTEQEVREVGLLAFFFGRCLLIILLYSAFS